MPLNVEDAAVIKGMLLRGDKQHDIAACFGVNGGRVAEIKTGDRFPEVKPADELPPAIAYTPPIARWRTTKGVKFNRDNKFDLQLSQALLCERRLAEIFANAKFETIELKSESYLWERTGNICIEYEQNGKPSGIAVTKADLWVHELLRDGKTLGYLMIPVDRLKELCKRARRHTHAGDGGRFGVYLIPLRDILK